MGGPPVEWWLDAYFRWLGRPYYLALQTAAASDGACCRPEARRALIARYAQAFPFGGTRETSIQTIKLDRFRPAPGRAQRRRQLQGIGTGDLVFAQQAARQFPQSLGRLDFIPGFGQRFEYRPGTLICGIRRDAPCRRGARTRARSRPEAPFQDSIRSSSDVLSSRSTWARTPPPLTVFNRTGLDFVRTFRRASDSRNASSITAVSVLPDSAACLLAWARRCSSSRTVVRMHQSMQDAHQYVK